MTGPRRIDRRRFLHGAGAVLALPLLESLAPRSRALAVRLAYVYVPNGVDMRNWQPPDDGTEPLSGVLAPFQELRSELGFLSGLTCDKARANGDGPGDHARACAAFLTCAQPYKDAGRVHVGVSADQLAARHLGGDTRLASLVVGAERSRRSGQCDSGYACAYSGNLSWSGPQTAATKETDPGRVFERLFFGRSGLPGGGTAEERRALWDRRKSVLDYVRGEARALEGNLGRADRHKLDEYLTAVRELERRVAVLSGEQEKEATAPRERPAEPADFGEHLRVLYELIALAFEADITRVATFLVANEGSNRSYPNLDVAEGHHTISHHGGDEAKQEQIRRINLFHAELFAAFLERLRSTREGEGNLLERCMIVYGAAIADGNRHSHHDLPILLAGHGAGSLSPGRHVRYPRETPLANLHLALLERLGVSPARFGDGTGVLDLSGV